MEPVRVPLPSGEALPALLHRAGGNPPGTGPSTRAVVVFSPGSRGGVGPGCPKARASEFDASVPSIYSTVARKLAAPLQPAGGAVSVAASLVHTYREPPIDARNVKNPRSTLADGVEDCMAAMRQAGLLFGKGVKLVLVGYSFGGCVALGAAGRAMEDPELRHQLLGLGLIGSATGGMRWRECAEDRIPVQETLRALEGRPLLVLHGEDDRNVHCRVGQDLYMRAAEPKTFAVVEGAPTGLPSRSGR